MTQLLNAHLAYRIISLDSAGEIQAATTYKRLKERLNELCSFKSSLLKLHRNWEFDASDGNPLIDEPLQPLQEDFSVPGKSSRKLNFFNNNPVGKQRRLESRYPHTGITMSKRICYICRGQTSVFCRTCLVFLCQTSFGDNIDTGLTCWKVHHTHAEVRQAVRVLENTASDEGVDCTGSIIGEARTCQRKTWSPWFR